MIRAAAAENVAGRSGAGPSGHIEPSRRARSSVYGLNPVAMPSRDTPRQLSA